MFKIKTTALAAGSIVVVAAAAVAAKTVMDRRSKDVVIKDSATDGE
jgi:hypothetical protein